jgi:hypothetical protein
VLGPVDLSVCLFNRCPPCPSLSFAFWRSSQAQKKFSSVQINCSQSPVVFLLVLILVLVFCTTTLRTISWARTRRFRSLKLRWGPCTRDRTCFSSS